MARSHSLMTKEIESQLPPLYSQEKTSDPMVYVKYFSPYSNWTWLITEGSRRDGDLLMFGLVKGFETEFGYVSLNELEGAVRGGVPLIERDLYWTPCPLSEARTREGF